MGTPGKISALSTRVEKVECAPGTFLPPASGHQRVRPLRHYEHAPWGFEGRRRWGKLALGNRSAGFLPAGSARYKTLAFGVMETRKTYKPRMKSRNGALYLSPHPSYSLPGQKTKWAPHGFPPRPASPPGPSFRKTSWGVSKGGGNFEKGTALGVGEEGVVHSPGHGPRAALEPGRVSLQDTQTFEPSSRPFQTGR